MPALERRWWGRPRSTLTRRSQTFRGNFVASDHLPSPRKSRIALSWGRNQLEKEKCPIRSPMEIHGNPFNLDIWWCLMHLHLPDARSIWIPWQSFSTVRSLTRSWKQCNVMFLRAFQSSVRLWPYIAISLRCISFPWFSDDANCSRASRAKPCKEAQANWQENPANKTFIFVILEVLVQDRLPHAHVRQLLIFWQDLLLTTQPVPTIMRTYIYIYTT